MSSVKPPARNWEGTSVLWADAPLLFHVAPFIKFRACILRLMIVSQQAVFGRSDVDHLLLPALYASDKVREKCGLVIGNKKCFIYANLIVVVNKRDNE